MVFKKVNQTLERILIGSKYQLKTTQNEHQKSKTRSHDKPKTFLQYIGNLTQNFARDLKKLCDLQVIFITQKLRSCLAILKSSFDRNLQTHVLYEIKCNGCGSIYVGHTSWHVTNRISEHQKRIHSWISIFINLVAARMTLNGNSGCLSHSRETHDHRSYIWQ